MTDSASPARKTILSKGTPAIDKTIAKRQAGTRAVRFVGVARTTLILRLICRRYSLSTCRPDLSPCNSSGNLSVRVRMGLEQGKQGTGLYGMRVELGLVLGIGTLDGN